MPYPAYLFDLDGTLYRGEEPMPHADTVLSLLRGSGAKVRFLTNNSGATPEFIAPKLRRMGIEAHPSEVVTSGMAAASFLASKGWKDLFVIGEPGLVEVLQKAGLNILNLDPLTSHLTPLTSRHSTLDPRPSTLACAAVLCGICRTFTYDLLDAALQMVLKGAAFVATNLDPVYPIEGGRLQPGAGSLVAALRTCSGVEPHLCGKPQPDMLLLAAQSCGVRPEEALVVGDREDTDIEAARRAGCPSVLVMTGVTSSPPEGVRAIRDLSELTEP